MSDFDEYEIISELVGATGEAATLAYTEWTHAVSTNVRTSRGVGTWGVVAYNDHEGVAVDLFDHDDINRRVRKNSSKLLEAQSPECVALKCTVARSGHFEIDYSYNIDEAIKWAGDFFGGSTPEELVEVLRPVDLSGDQQ